MGKRKAIQLIVWREVTKKECPWLARTYEPGEVLYKYEGPTYGCVSTKGIAFTEKAK